MGTRMSVSPTSEPSLVGFEEKQRNQFVRPGFAFAQEAPKVAALFFEFEHLVATLS